MQHLDVAGWLYADVLDGSKTNTMRWQETRIVQGPLSFTNCEARDQSVIVNVTRCHDVPLRNAAAQVGLEQVWPDDKMLAAMRIHYPTITLEDTVQIVEFVLAT